MAGNYWRPAKGFICSPWLCSNVESIDERREAVNNAVVTTYNVTRYTFECIGCKTSFALFTNGERDIMPDRKYEFLSRYPSCPCGYIHTLDSPDEIKSRPVHTTPISVSVQVKIAQLLREIAYEERRTVSSLINEAVIYWAANR